MNISNDIHLAQRADDAFAILTDLDVVAPCLPGATIGAEEPDGARAAAIEVKFGPMRFRYEGTIRIVETDAAAGRAVMVAEGRETSGEGTARADIAMQVSGAGEGADVHIETELHVSGGIAQIGRGMIEEVGQELMDDFAACLSDDVARGNEPGGQAAPKPAPAPVQANRLIARVLLRRIRRLFGGKG
jgi:hypothetical protein